MFEALIITLREGVEAALVLSIALALLRRRALDHLRPALFAGAGLAVVLSVVAAVVTLRVTYNQELAEGVALLVGCVLVVSLVWWMWRHGPHFKEEIEAGMDRATESRARGAPAAAVGVFLFAFGMVLREGAETAIFLSATGLDSQVLSMWVGAAIGLSLATVFGVLFVRGAIRIPLRPFFTITSVILLLIAAQLLVAGLHELSEAMVLPASKTEMAIIGPIVKNELLLFSITVAIIAGWFLMGRPQPAPASESTGPDARLARATVSREARLRRGLGFSGLLIVALLITAFVQQSRMPARAPAEAVTAQEGLIQLDVEPLGDGHMRFYEAQVEGTPIRFFALKVGEQYKTCFDACLICGDIGYFEESGSVICRNCTSPIVASSLGRPGGCNPIPLPHQLNAGQLLISEADLRAAIPDLKGR